MERTADRVGHARRPTPLQLRARPAAAGHARGSRPGAAVRGTHPRDGASAAVLEERVRIARELHDSVAQTLYAITLAASRARNLIQQDDPNEAQRIFDDVLQLAAAGQSELRVLLSDLRSEQFACSALTAALTSLARDARARHGLDIRLSLTDEPDLPARTKHTLAMIVREALHNVVKHSAARRVDIVLERDAEALVLRVTDDGRGFDTAASRPGHFGLQSMRERAASADGSLDLLSAVGRGTQVRVTIPAHRDRDG